MKIPCPYLGDNVELSKDREQHITETHPDLLPEYWEQITLTLANPDQVQRSRRSENCRLFLRWHNSVKEGKYVVVVVATNAPPSGRSWILTAYIARKLPKGEMEWKKS